MTSGTDSRQDRITLTHLADACVPDGPPVTVTSNFYFKSWSGTNSPRGGPRRDNPYTMSTITQRNDAVQYVSVSPSGAIIVQPGNVVTCVGFAPSPSDPGKGNAQLSAINDLFDTIRGSTFDGGTFLGEGHQSLQMIGDASRKIKDAFLAAKRLQIQKALQILGLSGNISQLPKDLASLWLALQYGWLPLLSDIKDAADAVSAILQKDELHSANGSGVAYSSTSGYSRLNVRKRKTKYKATFRGKPGVAQRLGLTDPASLVWELLPYSFVADWALPIGDYLSAHGKVRDFKLDTVCESNIDRYNVGRGSANGLIGGEAAFQKSFNFERVVHPAGTWGVANVPLPNVRPLDAVASYRHAITGISLLVQAFR